MLSHIRIIIADDHEIFRNGFKLLLKDQEDVELVSEAGNGKELVHEVQEHLPDIVITDIKMPEMDGIEACAIIQKEFPATRLIALSMFNDENLVVDMLEAGANGYLLKNTTKMELFLAVRAVYEGGTYYCNGTSQKLTKLIATSHHNPFRHKLKISLSGRERDIMRLICQEYTNKEIASILNLSIRTIESYREKIQDKIEAKNTVGIVVYAIRHNIFQL